MRSGAATFSVRGQSWLNRVCLEIQKGGNLAEMLNGKTKNPCSLGSLRESGLHFE